MVKEISVGNQDFGDMRKNGDFYIDKSLFIKEWWNSRDIVTLIARPRRFGKTINMSMLDYFFSMKHADQSEMFENLTIWEDEKFRNLQGTYPVIFLSFAGIKGTDYHDSVAGIKKQLAKTFQSFPELYEYDGYLEMTKKALLNITESMSDVDAQFSLNMLSDLLEKYYHKKVLIFLDEYDTPLQEAYIHGYWKELVSFTRGLFNNTFKTNPSLERG